MPSVSPDAQEAALPYRVYGLEGMVKTQDAAISALGKTTAAHSEAIGAQAVTLARHEEQLTSGHSGLVDVKTDVAALAVSVSALAEKTAASVNRVAFVLTGFAFTVAASAIGVIVFGTP